MADYYKEAALMFEPDEYAPDIVKFIYARLKEDEHRALRAASDAGECWPDGKTFFVFETKSVADHVSQHDPARVLRAVAAKRRILEIHAHPKYLLQVNPALRTLRALASEWSDHPSYRQEWRP